MLSNNSYPIIKSFLFVSFLFMLTGTSCKKEEIDTETKEFIETSVEMNISISGFIKDEDNSPAEGVTVIIDDHYETSDENGFYSFDKVNVQGPRMNIKFRHSAFHENYKTVDIHNDGRFHQDVIMIDLGEPFNFSSTSGGEVKIDDVLINFQADGFVSDNGDVYSGLVSAYPHYFDPTSNDFSLSFPSNFDVLNEDVELKIMQVFSGLSVELYGSSGQKLQINKDATIRIRIPDELLSSAPDVLELGHYDEERRIWEGQSSALRNGDYYESTVSHFSFWCCFIMEDAAYLSGYVFEDINEEFIGIPMEDLYVEVKIAGTSITGSVRTSANGSFFIKVPKNLELDVNIYANSFNEACGNPIYTEEIFPMSNINSLELGNILLNAEEMVIVTGSAKACNGNNLDGGFVFLENNDGDLLAGPISSDGTFTIPMYKCSDVFSLIIYDIDFNYASEQIVNLSSDTINILGDVLACEVQSTPPYLLYVVTGSDTIIASAAEGFENNATDVDGNISSLIYAYFEADIKNTSQPLYEGACSILANISGLEDQACEMKNVEIVIPLKDSESDVYLFRAWPDSEVFPDTWTVSYNCIEDAEYLHLNGRGLLEKFGEIGQIVTHRDPEVLFDIYFPLD